VKNIYNFKRFRSRYAVAMRQARETGHIGQVAHLMARSAVAQAAIVSFLSDQPDNGRALVDLEYEREFSRLLREGDKVWYARAAASVAAAEVALQHGVRINWENVVKNAGLVAGADDELDDDEAARAADVARAEWRSRIPVFAS
jgi:hypothetical protein